MKAKIHYKIKLRGSELFSTCGYHPEWSEIGQTWKTLHSLKAYIKEARRRAKMYDEADPFHDAVIQSYRVEIIKDEEFELNF